MIENDQPEKIVPVEDQQSTPSVFASKRWLSQEFTLVGHESWHALKILLVLLIVCGIVFPALVYGLGQLFFPAQANGSLISNAQHQIVGSKLIGQQFTSPVYFHGRPSVTNYNASNSSGSNIGPTNPQLINGNGSEVTVQPGATPPANATPVPGKANTYYVPGTYAGIKNYAGQFRQENHLAANTPLPMDIVTASGSGLDPDISVDAATLQINRIVEARQALGGRNASITVANLQTLVEKHT
ncbi:MAG TPA: potassium-transporting ATPase subunit C, partial [Ktedonobacteraceae bacterium]